MYPSIGMAGPAVCTCVGAQYHISILKYPKKQIGTSITFVLSLLKYRNICIFLNAHVRLIFYISRYSSRC